MRSVHQVRIPAQVAQVSVLTVVRARIQFKALQVAVSVLLECTPLLKGHRVARTVQLGVIQQKAFHLVKHAAWDTFP